MAVSLYLYTTLGALYLPLLLSAFALQNFRLAAVVVIIAFEKIFRWFFDSPKSFASKFSLNSVLSDNWLWPHGICHCILDFWGAKLLTWLQSKKSNSIDFAFGDSSIFNLRPLLYLECVRELNRSSQVFAKFHWPLYPSIYLSPLLLLLLLLLFSSVSLRLLWFTLRFGWRTLRWFCGGRGKGLKCMWYHWLFFFSSLLLVNSCNAAVVHKQRRRRKKNVEKERVRNAMWSTAICTN